MSHIEKNYMRSMVCKMKYITYLHNNKESVGFLNESDNVVYPLPFADMNALIEAPKEKLEVAIKEAKNKILLSDCTDSKTKAGCDLPWNQLQGACR